MRLIDCQAQQSSWQTPGSSRPGTAQAFLTLPGFDAFVDRERGDGQRDHRIQPPPAERGVGSSPASTPAAM